MLKNNKEILKELKEYIAKYYVEDVERSAPTQINMSMAPRFNCEASAPKMSASINKSSISKESLILEDIDSKSFEETINGVLDESFAQMLFRKIDEKGFKKDSDCYKKANIDRKLFSKIRSDDYYSPNKSTVYAFAIALESNISETKEMLMKAGFAMSHSNRFDVAMEYFIKNKIYDVFKINAILYDADLQLLGSNPR